MAICCLNQSEKLSFFFKSNAALNFIHSEGFSFATTLCVDFSSTKHILHKVYKYAIKKLQLPNIFDNL